MPIRSTEQFKRDCSRGFGHVKSKELNDVIKKLEIYHRKTTVSEALRSHLLNDLRDAVVTWGRKNPREFAARRGAELAHEVMVAHTSDDREHFDLVNGDILFRWVPRGIGQRGILQGVIATAQGIQDDTHRSAGLEGTCVDVSAMVVQHVGVYADGRVYEIGAPGLSTNPVELRDHYDLVVRSRAFGPQIADSARRAVYGFHRYGLFIEDVPVSSSSKPSVMYPVWDLGTGPFIPNPGGSMLYRSRILLRQDDAEYRTQGTADILRQRVVCSHFVNAVLYAATGGTLATATDHAYDDIFKIGPAQMWREFLRKIGLWANAQAVFVGVQHKGELDRNIDPRTLGVGLTRPAVPTTEGRPPIAPPLPSGWA